MLSETMRPVAEVLLLRALEIASERGLGAGQVLDLLKRAGWALVPREAPKDSEVWDMCRTAAVNAAYSSDDIFAAVYAAVVGQAENTLRNHLAILDRLADLPPAEELGL